MDSPCYVNCPVLKEQTIAQANECSVKNNIDEDIDGCKYLFLSNNDQLANSTFLVGLPALPGYKSE